MYKLEYFYYILEIYKVGSINSAAQNLYVSQPYLSQCLKNIEDILGTEIFKRTNKGVTPTDAGKEFIEYSTEIIEIINKLGDIKNKYTSTYQNFSIASMPSYTILDLFHNFKDIYKEKYEHCKISYEEIPNTFIAEQVMNGFANIGIVYTSSTTHSLEIKNFEEMSLNFVPLIKEPLSAIVSRHSELYNKDKVTLKELKSLDFLVENIKLSNNKPPIPNNPLPEIFKTNTKLNLVFNNNRSMLYYLTKRSDCFCVGQKSLNLTNPLLDSGHLKYIPIDDLDVHFTTGYLTNENVESSDIEEYFIDFIEKFFNEV